MQPLIITVDGPAGAGKSTVALQLAKRLGVEFLDTGAMYRGLTAFCLDRGVHPASEIDAVIDAATSVQLRFDWLKDPPRLHVDEQDVSDRLRDADTTKHVGDVAQISAVRKILVKCQQLIGHQHPRLVSEGRDQGSVVFPDANVKFYLDATPEVRACRRCLQLRKVGQDANQEAILEQIRQRDSRDRTRRDGPLICPDDAQWTETSSMTLDEVVDLLVDRVRQQVNLDREQRR